VRPVVEKRLGAALIMSIPTALSTQILRKSSIGVTPAMKRYFCTNMEFSLRIYNSLRDRNVRELIGTISRAGNQCIDFDGRDDRRAKLAAGTRRRLHVKSCEKAASFLLLR
jgi:hypothetical protein